jgi:hypothetical protein
MMLRPCKPRGGPYRRRTEKRIVITDRKSIANIHELTRRTDLTMDAAIDMACDERLARIEREMSSCRMVTAEPCADASSAPSLSNA